MFVEVSYTNGRCPLCGGTPVRVSNLDSARDMSISGSNGSKLSYANYVTYSAICSRCFMLWYVRTYSWIDHKKSGHTMRRNYIDYKDYIAFKPMFIDMVYLDAKLLEKDMTNNAII